MNPGNWFGSSQSRQVSDTQDGDANPLLPEAEDSIFAAQRERQDAYQGTLVDQVTALEIEQTASGAIIRAKGQSLQQNAHDVRLTSDTDGKPVAGVLSYRLRAVQPQDAPQGPAHARRFQAAVPVSKQILANVNAVQVIGARNIMTVRR